MLAYAGRSRGRKLDDTSMRMLYVAGSLSIFGGILYVLPLEFWLALVLMLES